MTTYEIKGLSMSTEGPYYILEDKLKHKEVAENELSIRKEETSRRGNKS